MVFRVGMKGVRYSGQLRRTLLEQSQPGKVTLWLSLRNLKFSVKQTNIVGGPGGALCGPMDLVLGHKKDLWLAFDIETDTQSQFGADGCQERSLPDPPGKHGHRPTGLGSRPRHRLHAAKGGRRHPPRPDPGPGQSSEKRLTQDAPRLLAQIVKQTTPKNAESPLVRAIRARLQTINPQTAAVSLP